MASLREIKTKINSVKSTQQITSAMQMVSTVKLQRAQRIIENFLPYQQKISELLTNFLISETNTVSVFEEEREVKNVAIVAFTGNMSLCGSFNANVISELKKTLEEYSHLSKDQISIYAVGKKIAQACIKLGYKPKRIYEDIVHTPTYEGTIEIAEELMSLFRSKEIDRIEVIYHHFKSKGTQFLRKEILLPLSLDDLKEKEQNNADLEYIVEPDRKTLLKQLIPQVIKLKLYSYLLESHTSEHAARTLAMQAATDNADDLLDELSLVYNKSRQQSITNELLDIIGATFK